MIYRVRANLFFSIEDEANDFYHDCQIALPKSIIIRPGLTTEERGIISLEKCYHDQDPTKPCELDKLETL